MSQTNSSSSESGSKRDPTMKVIRTSTAHASLPSPKIAMGSSRVATSLNLPFALGAMRRWWYVAIPCGVLLAAAAVSVAYLTFRPIYEATAWLRISDTTPYVAFQSREDSRRFLETQMELMRSPLVIAPIMSNAAVAQTPELQKKADPIAWLGQNVKVRAVGNNHHLEPG
jgi:uncharacterized protein involved in exopolysaccharide biosynthesis